MDPYSVLGLNRDASEEEVKKAYKKMARTHHPDKGGSEEDFRKINEAYTKITKGADPAQDFPDLGELFSMFGFGGMSSAGLRKSIFKGPLVVCFVKLTLEELEEGGEYEVSYTRKIPTGKVVQSVSNTIMGQISVSVPEEVEREYSAKIKVPPCHDERVPLVFPGKATADKVPDSDMEVRVIVKEHKTFRRVPGTLDLSMELGITLKEALTGFERSVDSLSGNLISLTCASVVNPYDVKRLKGQGMCRPDGDEAACGDICIKFIIKFPLVLGDDAKKAIKEMEDLD